MTVLLLVLNLLLQLCHHLVATIPHQANQRYDCHVDRYRPNCDVPRTDSRHRRPLMIENGGAASLETYPRIESIPVVQIENLSLWTVPSNRSTLGKLRTFASTMESTLFALFHAGIARHRARIAQAVE